MSKSALEFAIFCIEAVAQRLTQSKQYIVDDILSLMRERGVLS